MCTGGMVVVVGGGFADASWRQRFRPFFSMGAGDRGAPSAPLFPLIPHSPEVVEQVNISR